MIGRTIAGAAISITYFVNSASAIALAYLRAGRIPGIVTLYVRCILFGVIFVLVITRKKPDGEGDGDV